MNDGKFTEHIIVRVPGTMKRAFAKLSGQKFKKEAELAREAFVKYFESLGIPLTEAIYPPHRSGDHFSTNDAASSKKHGEKAALKLITDESERLVRAGHGSGAPSVSYVVPKKPRRRRPAASKS